VFHLTLVHRCVKRGPVRGTQRLRNKQVESPAEDFIGAFRRRFADERGNVIYRYKRQIEHRLFSRRTAATLRKFLRSVVLRGTGDPTAQIPGYTTAGKTGTAQIVENGDYAPGQYVASFVGFVPAERPRYLILVKVVKPRGAIYGTIVAAPAFAKIAMIAMLHAGVLPTLPNVSAQGQRLVRCSRKTN